MWIAATAVFTLAIVWVLWRMAIAFATVLVGLQVATLLDAAGIIQLYQLAQLILLGGVATWMTIADLRTRLNR
ncbi:hypothetical protein [Streptomyces sp. NPDC003710]